jgi:hypothetical protein
MNTNSKTWSVTWETNRSQRKLPSVHELQKFFNGYADESIFQIEIGKQKKKKHIQGIFILSCKRKSKRVTLSLFEQNFKNTAGLTLSQVHDRFALESYIQKEDGRIAGPYYGGKKIFKWKLDLLLILFANGLFFKN